MDVSALYLSLWSERLTARLQKAILDSQASRRLPGCLVSWVQLVGKNTKMQIAHVFLLWFNSTRGCESTSCTKLREFNMYAFRVQLINNRMNWRVTQDKQKQHGEQEKLEPTLTHNLKTGMHHLWEHWAGHEKSRHSKLKEEFKRHCLK